MKFKVGDKVRIVKNVWEYGGNHPIIGINEVHTITKVYFGEKYPYLLDVYRDYTWMDKELELVENDKIVITNDGKTTTATLYRDGEKVKATAKCAPDDNFDFMVGANLALERLVDKTTKPEPPKYFNGKVVCVKSDGDFTVGKVYEIVDGIIRDNSGMKRPEPSNPKRFIKSMDDPWLDGCIYRFIPYVE